MKTALTLTLVHLGVLLFGQHMIVETFPISTQTSVYINFSHGDFEIRSWDRSGVQLLGDVIVNGQEDTEVFTIKDRSDDKEIAINVQADFDQVEYVWLNDIKEPTDHTSTFGAYNSEDGRGYGYRVKAKFILYIPRHMEVVAVGNYGKITILDSFKKVDIMSTYGSIDAEMSELGEGAYIKLVSTYSHVDLALVEDAGGRLSMSTGYGELFTDFDFDAQPDKRKGEHEFGTEFTTDLNEGPGTIELTSQYGNVYLRKAQ